MDARQAALVMTVVSVLAGCVERGVQNDVEGPAPDGADARGSRGPIGFSECQITLQVWSIPLDELRSKTPPEFPPQPLPEQGVDTPVGRIVFYLYDCATGESGSEPVGRGVLGLLGVRVIPPAQVAPPKQEPPWATMYLLDAFSEGAADRGVNASGIPWTPVEATVTVAPTALPDAPQASARVAIEGTAVFEATLQGLAGQVEEFSRPERYYWMDGQSGTILWLDTDFETTLWESAGRMEYEAGSPWAEAVGNAAYDVGVDHHAMAGGLVLSSGEAFVRGARPLDAAGPVGT